MYETEPEDTLSPDQQEEAATLEAEFDAREDSRVMQARRKALLNLALLGLAFLAGLYAHPDEPAQLIPVNRILDATTVTSGPGCTPDHFPDFPGCRVLVQEWDQNGDVSLSFTVSPDDPVSRIFE